MKEHITDGTPCWCNPEMTYKDPLNGAEVLVHKELQMTKEEIIEACKNSLNIYSFTAEALEKLMEAVRVEAPVRTKDLMDEDFVQSEVKSLRQQVAALKAVVDAWNNVEQEPVAWVDLEQWQSGEYDCFSSEKVADYMTPLYTAPVRTKDLTDDEISKLRHKIDWTAEWSYVNFARAVIAADREKNK